MNPDYSIDPSVGYLSAGMEQPLNITFHPKTISQDIRYPRVPCKIEGSKDPLYLTLTGSCTNSLSKMSGGKDQTTIFNCIVRSKDSKTIMVKNTSNQKWIIRPIIDGSDSNWWIGPDRIVIDPQTSKPVEFVYRPLLMTHINRKHQATVFLPLPDGNGLLHTFIGTAEPPKQIIMPTREVPCKTKHTEVLHVLNWLKKRQRFRVQIEMNKSDGRTLENRTVGSGQRPTTQMEQHNVDQQKPIKQETATALTGLDYIDVPASEKRGYTLNFFAHKEGIVQAKVN